MDKIGAQQIQHIRTNIYANKIVENQIVEFEESQEIE